MKIFRQLLKEFWFPFLGAIIWVLYSLHEKNNSSIKDYIATFGPSFFLISWMTGQFFRVKKQTTVESNLGSIEERVRNLLTQLEKHSRNLVGHVTGGDTFIYLRPELAIPLKDGDVAFKSPFIIEGEYGIEHVDIWFISGWVNWTDKRMVFNNVNSRTIGRIETQIKAHITNDSPARFHIFYAANNGTWIQDLSISKIGDSFKAITQVYSSGEDKSVLSLDKEFDIDMHQ